MSRSQSEYYENSGFRESHKEHPCPLEKVIILINF